jgi:hypothetical protein
VTEWGGDYKAETWRPWRTTASVMEHMETLGLGENQNQTKWFLHVLYGPGVSSMSSMVRFCDHRARSNGTVISATSRPPSD